jgi:hypothetical protein
LSTIVPSPDDITDQQRLLATHRRTLAVLVQQHAEFGMAFVPPHIVHGIREARERIRQCKATLRSWNQSVEDLPNDDDEIASAATHVGGALRNMAALMQAPEIRSELSEFQDSFRLASHQLDLLNIYKALHDQLHDLQFRCYRPIMSGAGDFPNNAAFLAALSFYITDFKQIIDTLREITDQPHCPKNEHRWIEQLALACEFITSALDRKIKEPFDRAVFQIERILNLDPTRINEQLKQAARNLPLDQLLQAMHTVQGHSTQAIGEVRQSDSIMQGIVALEQLQFTLYRLIDEHDTWQRFEIDLRQYESDLARYLPRLQWLWESDLKSSVAAFYARRNDRWIRDLYQAGERLERALAEPQSNAVVEAFRAFHSSFSKCFFQTDKELKDQCGKLRLIDGPLTSVIGMLG